MKNNATHSIIEALESRIAPAAVFSFTDVDGDAVTIKTSKGTNAQLAGSIAATMAGIGVQILEIDFSNNAAVFAGTDLILSVVKKPGGDGLVNIGFVDASDADGSGTKMDLGTVVIPGDIGQIDAGDTNSNTPAIKSLAVRSIGTLGLSTQGGGGQLQSDIRGGVGSIAVKGDIRDALLFFTNNGMGTETQTKLGTLSIGGSLIGGGGGATGFITGLASIGSVTIGGSIVGGGGTDTGSIKTTGDIGSLKVAGNIVGGAGIRSGGVTADGTIKSITVGGSIKGGGDLTAGAISSSGPGTSVVKIGRDIVGGTGLNSGKLSLLGVATSLTIGGSIVGGSAQFAGNVYLDEGAGVVKIGGSVIGGSAANTGEFRAAGEISSLAIGGSVVGGSNGHGGIVDISAKTGNITVKGSLIAGSGIGSIRFGGAKSVFIGGSIVGGDRDSGSAGFDGTLNGYSGDIGSIVVGGNIIGGNITGTADATRVFGGIFVGNVGKILVKGSIIAGTDNSSGTLKNSGTITSDGTVGSITILGSVIGNATHRVNISATGSGTAPAGATQELAIGKITIGGNVTRADLIAGFQFGNAEDGDSSIGSVVVKGDWTASSISAGVKDMGANGFGGADDVILPDNNNAAIASRIASIVIGGAIGGSATAGDTFGFVAQQIGSVKIGGSTIFTGTAATDAVKAIPNITNDLFIREVA